MSVYVDDMWMICARRFGRMVMCHMIADTTDELNAMADRIGVARKWIQKPGTEYEHYDVSLGARRKAVELGAIEITIRELAMKCRARRLAAQAQLSSSAKRSRA